MIKIINGDIFSGTEDIICHQVNTFGVMGSGIALQIKKLYPSVFTAYNMFCKRYGDTELLGCVLPEMATKHRCIMNMFSQVGIGQDVRTDYVAMRECFEEVKRYAIQNNKTVAIPYKIGCGLARGDWKIVIQIIKEVFSDFEVVLYKLEV